MELVPVIGNADPVRICTSIVERQNLTIRIQMRRLTRLTSGFSNFCLIHCSIRVTPVMKRGSRLGSER
jgi:hypothetical protein